MLKQAAILRDGEIWTLPRPARHHNIIWAINDVDRDGTPNDRNKKPVIIKAHGAQGFIDGAGNFLEREQGAQHARN